MSEATLWRYLRDGLRPLRVDLSRHEDLLGVGVPDVSYGARGVNGWIELKAVKKWAKLRGPGGFKGLPGAKVPWRTGQRDWLLRRGAQGGRTWMLLRVGRVNYLFPQTWLPRDDLPVTKAQSEVSCALHWETGEDVWSELLEVLTK